MAPMERACLMRSLRPVAVVAVLMLLAGCNSSVLVGTAPPSPTPHAGASSGSGFLEADLGPHGEDENPGFERVRFLQWTVQADKVDGVLSEVDRNREGDGIPPTIGHADSFTGVLNGSTMTLNFASGATWIGRLEDQRLTVTSTRVDGTIATDVFVPGTVVDYDGAVYRLQVLLQSLASPATWPPGSPARVDIPPTAPCPGVWQRFDTYAEWYCAIGPGGPGDAYGSPLPNVVLGQELAAASKVTTKAACDRFPDMLWYAQTPTGPPGTCRNHA